MSQSEQRFDNVLGEEYDLLKLAYPHYDDLERAAAKTISDHYVGSEQKIIQTFEIGCGSGITTKFLLEADPRLHIVAIDSEPKMLHTFRKNLVSWQAENRVDLVESDAFKYIKTIDDNTFDAVASGFVLHNFETGIRDQLISEIYRILKPGGIFVNADKYAHDDPVKRAEIYKKQIERYDIYDTIGRSDYKKEWVAHMDRDEKDDLVFFEGKAKEYMTKIGFKNVKTNYREMMEAVVSGVK